jgi:trehalose 2-sulfotransferase
MTSPSASYIVIGSPRSGTSLVCNVLDRTDVAGRPNEYFWRDTAGQLWKDWRVPDEATYLSKVLELGTTPNGDFAVKLMWTYLDEALDFLRRTTGRIGEDDAALLGGVFPQPKYIWVWRDDVVAQAVSWAKAVQTDEWYSGDPRRSSKAPTFDFSQVHGLVMVATQLHFVAARWFGQHRIRPFMVCYEDLVNDVDGTLRAILAFLKIPFPENRPITPSLRRQRDAVNAEWVRRYRESAQDPPAGAQ